MKTRILISVLLCLICSRLFAMSAYDFELTDIRGKTMPLKKYKGKVLLLVNTASKCGYTPQYKQLQELYAHYKNDGFIVIGIPSDDFNQEFTNMKEVLSFTEEKYAITFPLTSLTHVKSFKAHPIYKWAYSILGDAAVPKWNFHKLLINRKGELVAAFNTQEEPMSTLMINAVHKALNQK